MPFSLFTFFFIIEKVKRDVRAKLFENKHASFFAINRCHAIKSNNIYRIISFLQAQHVCGKTLPWYKRRHDAGLDECDEALNCPDGSDELCGDPCIAEGFTGRFTLKVCDEH